MTRTEQLLVELDRLGRGTGSRPPRRTSSFADYRRHELAATRAQDRAEVRSAFWKYVLEDKPRMTVAEQRALSKASGGVGGFLVPTDLHDQIVATARTAGSISSVAREIVTESGDTIGVPTTTGHGSAAWVAEAGAGASTDETFGQLALNAFKAHTQVIVSEELAQDAGFGFDASAGSRKSSA
jgi:HK97 family phage major capsid protein